MLCNREFGKHETQDNCRWSLLWEKWVAKKWAGKFWYSIFCEKDWLYFSFGFYADGHFLVAVSSGNISLPIRCFRVLVRKNDEKCSITSQALPSFFLHDGSLKDSNCKQAQIFIINYRKLRYSHCHNFRSGTSVTHLKFVVREDADSLVVAANSESGGFVEVWELREKSQPVHKLFQPKTLEPFKTVVRRNANDLNIFLPTYRKSLMQNLFVRFFINDFPNFIGLAASVTISFPISHHCDHYNETLYSDDASTPELRDNNTSRFVGALLESWLPEGGSIFILKYGLEAGRAKCQIFAKYDLHIAHRYIVARFCSTCFRHAGQFVFVQIDARRRYFQILYDIISLNNRHFFLS